MKKSSIVISVLAIGILSLLFYMAAQPVEIVKKNCEIISGTVSAVKENRKNDIVISLQGKKGINYINKGAEKIDASVLKDRLIGKDVELYYIKPTFFSNLSPMTSTRHIAEISVDQHTVYSEFN